MSENELLGGLDEEEDELQTPASPPPQKKSPPRPKKGPEGSKAQRTRKQEPASDPGKIDRLEAEIAAIKAQLAQLITSPITQQAAPPPPSNGLFFDPAYLTLIDTALRTHLSAYRNKRAQSPKAEQECHNMEAIKAMIAPLITLKHPSPPEETAHG
jgi:hypothetical protein